MEMEVKKINLKYEFHTYYLKQKLEGMSYAQIRNELYTQDLDEQEIREIIRGIDNEVLRLVNVKERNRKAYATIFFGSFLLIAGIIMTTGFIQFSLELFNHTLLPISLTLGGFSTIFVGLAQLRKYR